MLRHWLEAKAQMALNGKRPDLTDVEYWEARAEEARATAETFTDEGAKETMVGIAKSYDYLAQTARTMRDQENKRKERGERFD